MRLSRVFLPEIDHLALIVLSILQTRQLRKELRSTEAAAALNNDKSFQTVVCPTVLTSLSSQTLSSPASALSNHHLIKANNGLSSSVSQPSSPFYDPDHAQPLQSADHF